MLYTLSKWADGDMNSFGITEKIDTMNGLRWRCLKCQRIEPRHSLTRPEEMQFPHTTLLQMGNMWGQLCDGERVPERWDEEKKEWVDDETVIKE